MRRRALLLLGIAVGIVGASALSPRNVPAASPEEGVLFVGTWDGPTPFADWSDVHSSYAGGDLTLVRDPARPGRVAKVDLPAGGPAAVEAIHHRLLQPGTTATYGLAFKFPRGWTKPTDGWGCAIAQLAYPLLKYTSIGVFASDRFVGLEMHTGRIDWQGRKPSAENDARFDFYLKSTDPRGHLIPRTRFAIGKWNFLLIRIRFATDATGSLEAWHRVEGEPSWTRTVELDRIPTMQWGYGINGNYYGPDGKDPQGELGQVSDKVGAYRDESPRPTELFNDGLVIASNPDIAARLLAGPSFAPRVRAVTVRSGQVGHRYSAQLVAVGGVAPLRWEAASTTVPPGVAVTRAGVLRGTPTRAGSWRTRVSVTDAQGRRSMGVVRITIRR